MDIILYIEKKCIVRALHNFLISQKKWCKYDQSEMEQRKSKRLQVGEFISTIEYEKEEALLWKELCATSGKFPTFFHWLHKILYSGVQIMMKCKKKTFLNKKIIDVPNRFYFLNNIFAIKLLLLLSGFRKQIIQTNI